MKIISFHRENRANNQGLMLFLNRNRLEANLRFRAQYHYCSYRIVCFHKPNNPLALRAATCMGDKLLVPQFESAYFEKGRTYK